MYYASIFFVSWCKTTSVKRLDQLLNMFYKLKWFVYWSEKVIWFYLYYIGCHSASSDVLPQTCQVNSSVLRLPHLQILYLFYTKQKWILLQKLIYVWSSAGAGQDYNLSRMSNQMTSFEPKNPSSWHHLEEVHSWKQRDLSGRRKKVENQRRQPLNQISSSFVYLIGSIFLGPTGNWRCNPEV